MLRLLLALLVAATLSVSADARPVKACTPPFPYSCTKVRWAVDTFPRSWLEAEGKRRGMTACHKARAIACINGAP